MFRDWIRTLAVVELLVVTKNNNNKNDNNNDNNSYICGRCAAEFDDFIELDHHEKTQHIP